MEPLFTPRNKKVFIDETILNTPLPQATSTVERKTMSFSRKPKEKLEQLDLIPVQEYENRTESRASSHSSLGILTSDNLNDFSFGSENKKQDSKFLMPHPNSVITEELLLQRQLAQKSIDRANKKDGILSRLLKPSDTPAKNTTNNTTGVKYDDSTVNASDLENMMSRNDGEKISFEAKEISARSSSLGNETNQIINLSTPSPNRSSCSEDDNMSEYNEKCQAIFDKIRRSDNFINQMCTKKDTLDPKDENELQRLETIIISDESNNSWNFAAQDSLMAKLQNELFTPAELAEDKLAADELSWRKAHDTIPLDIQQNGKDRLELSCFSGYIGDRDMSSTSKLGEKMSIGEYFNRRNENVDALNLQPSPEKKRRPIPLIADDATITTDSMFECPRSRISEHSAFEPPRPSLDSVVSVSHIAEVLGNMNVNETPSKMINYLMNQKKTQENVGFSNNKLIPSETQILKYSTNTFKNDPRSSNISTIQSIKSNRSPTRNITPTKNLEAYSSRSKSTMSTSTLKNTIGNSTGTSTLKNTQMVNESPTKVIEILSSDSESKENVIDDFSKLRRSSNYRSALKDSSNIPVIEINDTVDEGWKDAKGNIPFAPEKDKTLSSITESPSISCSELEFSEDDPDSTSEMQNSFDDWVKIQQDTEPHRACVMVGYETEITMVPLSNHWLTYKVSLGEVKVEGEKCGHVDHVIRLQLPDKEELLKFDANENICCVQFITYICGKIELKLVIQLKDMVTKKQKEVEHTLVIESEEAEIAVMKNVLNFDILPEESHKILEFSIINNSKFELPISLAIIQDKNIYSFFQDCPLDFSNPEYVTRTKLVLTSESTVNVPIEIIVPSLAFLQCTTHVAELIGKVVVYLETETSKVLKEVQLIGQVGMTKIQFRSSCLPMILAPGQTKALQMKNSGVLSMELNAFMVDSSTKIPDENFIIDPRTILLKPNQSNSINVTFSPEGKVTESVHRVLRLHHPAGPTFVCAVEGTPIVKSPILNKTTTLLSPRTSLSGRNSPRAQSTGSLNSPKYGKGLKPSGNSLSGRNSPRDQCKSISPGSGRSPSDSGTYLSNGKLPIESNKRELVWGCIKPGKSQTQEFIIRNRSLQRVRFHATLTGTGFKFIRDQSDSVTSMTMVLHGMESRTIVISFSPNTVGAAAAKLMFSPIDSDVMHKAQMIFLFGYGGNSVIDVRGVAKDPSAKMWLSFGRLNYRSVLEQSFMLRNSGTLASFAHLSLNCKALYPFIESNIKISPNEVVLLPNKEVEITVRFMPRQEDFKFMRNNCDSEVFEIASLQLVTGPEPTRGRIRRLFSKMNGSCAFSADLLNKLCKPFTAEYMPADLQNCKEKELANSLKELLQGLTTREISLTVEQDPEQSAIALGTTGDDTCMFTSLCNDTTHLMLDHTQFDNTLRRSSGGFCTIEPTKIMLTPPVKMMDTVLLSSKHSRPMPFEITIASGEIQVEPTVGMVPPGQTTVITVSCAASHSKQLQFFKVMVYVENEVLEVEVKVVQVQQRRSITPRR